MTQNSKISQSYSVDPKKSKKHSEKLFDQHKEQIVSKGSNSFVQSRMNMTKCDYPDEKSSRYGELNHDSSHLQRNSSRMNYNHALELQLSNIGLSSPHSKTNIRNDFFSNQNQEQPNSRDQTQKINLNSHISRNQWVNQQSSRMKQNIEYVRPEIQKSQRKERWFNQPNQPSMLNVQNISCQQSILLSNQVQQLQELSDEISCQPSSYMLSSQNPLGYDDQTIQGQGDYLSQQDKMNYVKFAIDLGMDQKQRNENQALKHFDQALSKIVKYHGGSSNQQYIICLKQKINCLRNLEEFCEAIKCSQQYVEIAKNMYQPNSTEMREALKCLDQVLTQQWQSRVQLLEVFETMGFIADDPIKSLEFYQSAYATLNKSPHIQSDQYLFMYEKTVCNYGRALIANKKYSKACQLFDKANGLFLEKKGDSPLLCFRILFANALLLGKNYDLSSCIKYSDMALLILEQGFVKFDNPMNNNQGAKKQFIRYLHQLLEMQNKKELINKQKNQSKINKGQDTIKLLVHEEFLNEIRNVSELSYQESEQQSFFNLIQRLQNLIKMIQVYHQKFCKQQHQSLEESN